MRSRRNQSHRHPLFYQTNFQSSYREPTQRSVYTAEPAQKITINNRPQTGKYDGAHYPDPNVPSIKLQMPAQHEENRKKGHDAAAAAAATSMVLRCPSGVYKT